MQEFNIPPSKTNIPQQPAPKADVSVQLPQTQIPLNQQQYAPIHQNPIKPAAKSKKMFPLILVGFMALVGCAVIFFAIGRLTSSRNNSGTTTTTSFNGQVTTTTTLPVTNPVYAGKIIYTDGQKIYEQYNTKDVQGETYEITKSETAIIKNLSYIDKNTAAFILFDAAAQTSSINQIFLDNQNITKIEDVSGDILLTDWYNRNTYIYAVLKDNKISIIYNDKDIKNNTITSFEKNTTSRDPFIEDYTNLKFSPEGDRLLFIDTYMAGFDFTTYVYSLEKELLVQIKDSTMSVWKDNDTILFRKYSNTESGFFYTYDLKKEDEQVIKDIPESSYSPSIKGNKMVYWENRANGIPYIYDFTTKLNTKMLDSGAFPVWIAEKGILVSSTKSCSDSICEGKSFIEKASNLEVESIHVINSSSFEVSDTTLTGEFLKYSYDIYWE